MISRPRFTADDADRAHAEWGANCGPGAIAAILGMTLDELRPHMGDFESKRYTNPTLMWHVLKGLGVKFSYRGGDLGQTNWPRHGLCRVQWHGPWMEPGVPIAARYRQTHWIGARKVTPDNVGIFDINAIWNGTGWCALADWSRVIVPFILEHVPRSDGVWSIMHAVEIEVPA